MSTFGALNTAFTGLGAARQGMSTVGQNIANANTAGYTRQRVTTSALGAPAQTGLFSGTVQPGQGASVDAIARMGDAFLDGNTRSTAAEAGYASTRAQTLTSIQDSMHEPGTDGISAQLNTFWSDWSNVANQPDNAAPAAVLLQDATVLAQKIATGYTDLSNQWSSTRNQADGMASDLNAAASQIAVLNGQIRSTVAAGGSANEMIDQRTALTTTIASLAGGTVRDSGNGTIDVVIGGNAIVSGTTSRSVRMTGPAHMDGVSTTPVQLEWSNQPGSAVGLDGGKIAGAISVLAAANSGGSGGAIAEAASSYNTFTVNLAASVNALHESGSTPTAITGTDFFSFAAGLPPAQGLAVLPTGVSGIASGKPGSGAYDGSNADAISQLGQAPNGPSSAWTAFVTETGTTARTAIQHGQLAESASTAAVQAQTANASVNLDEESVSLLSYQQAYQAAARVMTAADQALDTLINHTGIVGI